MSEWNAHDYSKNSSQQQKWAREIVPKLGLKGDERILDIGCGDGKVTAEIAQHAPRGSVVGIDASAEMIEFAQRNFPPQQFKNLQFQRGDAQALDFERQFDWVVSFACLHWIKDHRPVLAGIRRALRPGGRVLVQCGGRGNAAAVEQAAVQVSQRPQWAEFFVGLTFPWGFYGPEEYRPWLEEAGFKIADLRLIPKDMTQEGKEGLQGWMRTTWMPICQRAPADRRQDFLDDVVNQYVAHNPIDANGLVHVPMVRLQVEAAID
jgi:trans-aconitate 2-methyltransferase